MRAESDRPPLNRRGIIRLAVIGMLMGAAEVVPGVSGGTIAFISGVYERLIFALRQFSPTLPATLVKQGVAATWRHVDGNFLLTLFGTMLASIVLFASAIGWLLEHEPVAIWAFFFGLVLASIGLVGRQIGRFDLGVAVSAGFGAAIGAALVSVSPASLEPTPLLLFAGGAVAICAWILPGMSGSFLLLIMGLYAGVLEAIRSFDLISLGALAAGCGLGLMAFAQVLGVLLHKFRVRTISVLTGFMVGSLLKLWPWQAVIAYQIRTDGSSYPLVQEPVWPHMYTALTGAEPHTVLAVLMMVMGGVVVVVIDALSRLSGQES